MRSRIPIAFDDVQLFPPYGREEVRQAILGVLRKLPGDIARFAVGRCTFIAVGRGTQGLTLPGRIGVHAFEKRARNCWIIVIDARTKAEHLPALVAHEIAHAWRGDDMLGFSDDHAEEQACLLASQWGFTGPAADPGKSGSARLERMVRRSASRRGSAGC